MERRLFLAAALSLLVLLSWSALVSRSHHIDTQSVTEKVPLPPSVTPSFTPAAPTTESATPAVLPLINLSQAKFEITFVEPQAAIKEVEFKDYQSYKFPLKYGFLLGEKNLAFKKESVSNNQATFVYRDNDKQIIKDFTFHNSNYSIELEVKVQNLSNSPLKISLPLVLGVLDFGRDQAQARFQDVAVGLKDKTLHLNGRKEMSFEEAGFLGLRDRYFCAIIAPVALPYYGAAIKKINAQESEISLIPVESMLEPGQQMKQKFRIYLGPQELKLITSLNPAWSAVMYHGVFNFISHLLLQSLEVLYRLVHNWGWAIVILSIIIYLLFYPLTLKQMHSMRQMQVLQPAIEELKKAYKDNPQKLNKEIMELYRKHKVNPLGGCLPMILQIPVFFALYQALMRSIALKGANFLWIKDLSEPDRLFTLPVNLPILGNEVNILPILMSIGMFIQQKTSLATTTAGSSEQQKLMLILFPLMFGFIFYHMPAGLVLYWFINSSFMLLYQLRINRAK